MKLHRRSIVVSRAAAACEPLEIRRLLATYYVSPSGSDGNLGTTDAAPWRTFAKINALDLEPGDQVLFQGGATFNDPDVPAPVVNPGFESGTTGWGNDYGNAIVQAGIGHNSLRALRVGIGEGGMGQLVTSLVEPNKTYTFGAWARTSDPFELGFVGITFRDGAGSVVHRITLTIGGIFYKQYAQTFTAPASFASAEIWAYKYLGGNPFFLDVDNFSLVQNSNSIFLDASDAGTAQNPVRFGSYGTGRANIVSHTGLGMYVYNAGGYEIADLNFSGSGPSSNRASGITFFSDLPDNQKLDYVRIDNVNTSGYGDTGISIGGWYDPFSTNGYRDVRITNVESFNNGRAGIHTWGPGLYSHEDVTIADSRVYNTSGFADQSSGDGILMGSVNAGFVQRNVVYNNGTAGLGAVGVRAYNSNNVTVQSNESYDNRTSGPTDGGGFALDWGTTSSLLQYNYSHGNDGSGFLLAARSNTAANANNTIRYNISENDGRKNGYAGLHVWNEEQTIANGQVYNNTVFLSPAPGGASKAVWMQSPDPFVVGSNTDVKLRNNILVTTGGMRLVEVTPGQTGITFQGNNYWSSGGAFNISWANTVYNSLPAWRAATGQERDGVSDVGFNLDPMLAAPGAGGTVGNPDQLTNLAAYRTQAGSPMRNAALDLLVRFGINPGTRDFHGSPIPQDGGYDIGAHEAVPTDTIAPTVTLAQFHYQTRQDIALTFSEDVSASVALDDLVVVNLTTGQTLPPSAFTLSLAGGGGSPTTATWIAGSILPDANYRATLPAGSVADPAGNPLAADYVLDFFVLAGDANHDGTVNLSDFNALASNFGQSPRDFTQGDFNYDAIVNLQDFNILASRFGTTLGPGRSVFEEEPADDNPDEVI